MNFISSKYRAKIVGSGMCVPDRVVSNKDLAALMDTSDEWIQQRSGIKERRHVDDGTKPSDLAFVASKRAFEMAGCNASIGYRTIQAKSMLWESEQERWRKGNTSHTNLLAN